jgi:glutaredoxin
MTKLFLLKHDFTDSNLDKVEKKYFCPYCAMIEGILNYYPHIKESIEIQYVDFKKPRKAIVDLIGEENQSCPVLIIDNLHCKDEDARYFNVFGDKFYINTTELIAQYFTEKFKIGILH